MQSNLDKFHEDGFLVLHDVLSEKVLIELDQTINDLVKNHKLADHDTYLRESNLMECDPRFWQLLDVNPVFGYVKHLLCENPRLMTSELLIRQPNDDDPVAWHDDGPAYPSYRSLAIPAPLMQLKVGYFLTDCLEEGMGNLTVDSYGSHKRKDSPEINFENLPIMKQVCLGRGDAVLFHNALWHRVVDNPKRVERKNIYIGYCLPWMAPMDRSASSDILRASMPKEKQQILLDFEQPSQNYELRTKVFRDGLKGGATAVLFNYINLAKRRLRKIKRNLLGENLW